jgi:hypothetical protein
MALWKSRATHVERTFSTRRESNSFFLQDHTRSGDERSRKRFQNNLLGSYPQRARGYQINDRGALAPLFFRAVPAAPVVGGQR